jgi:hypothetical protein
MAKINTLLVGNQFRINIGGATGGEIKYPPADMLTYKFRGAILELTDHTYDKALRKRGEGFFEIPIADFQYNSADVNTEAEIAGILSDKLR